MTIKKILFRNWQFIQNFFIAPLPILEPCKTKGAVGAVCALLRNCQLGAQLLISVQDVAVNLKGSHRMVYRRIFTTDSFASLFNDDLSNEPNFGWIHLAGQYL
jgi:hypothetical protein